MMTVFPDGEESVVAECLSNDLGRIYLHIQGAKKITNKHRMMISPYSSVHIDCVQGKQTFRCTGIAEREPVFSTLTDLNTYRRKLLTQALGMIQRLVPVTNPIPEIFGVFETFYHRALDATHDDRNVYISYLV